MTTEDINNKNLVLIEYLNSIIDGYKIKAEYYLDNCSLRSKKQKKKKT